MKYGEMLREIRVQKEITLRELAMRSEIDVAYLSRVERGTTRPPQKEELLDAIDEALNMTMEEGQKLKDQAATDNEHFPKDIAQDVKDVVGLPMLLRTIANKKLSPEDMEGIIKYINEQY